MVSTTGLDAYLLDSYPRGSGEMAAWFNVGEKHRWFRRQLFRAEVGCCNGPLQDFRNPGRDQCRISEHSCGIADLGQEAQSESAKFQDNIVKSFQPGNDG